MSWARKNKSSDGQLTATFHEMDEVTDPIEPVSIQHLCTDIVIDGRLEQRYNHLVYVFERDGARLKARSYLDDIETVSILGVEPASAGASTKNAALSSIRSDAIAYFQRRYANVQHLTPHGYKPI